MTVLAVSLNGCLRIRSLNSKNAVVELRSYLCPGEWTYCVFRNIPLSRAWEIFHNQSQYHDDINAYSSPVIKPGE